MKCWGRIQYKAAVKTPRAAPRYMYTYINRQHSNVRIVNSSQRPGELYYLQMQKLQLWLDIFSNLFNLIYLPSFWWQFNMAFWQSRRPSPSAAVVQLPFFCLGSPDMKKKIQELRLRSKIYIEISIWSVSWVIIHVYACFFAFSYNLHKALSIE